MNTIDLFLHEAKLKTKYGYILYGFFLSFARYATDVFMLAGTHELTLEELTNQPRRQLSRRTRIWRLTGKLVILVQVTLALYFLGSLLADEALWLQIADPSVIDGVASRKDKFETAFFIIQFLLALIMLIGAAISVWYWQEETESIPDVCIFTSFHTPA